MFHINTWKNVHRIVKVTELGILNIPIGIINWYNYCYYNEHWKPAKCPSVEQRC